MNRARFSHTLHGRKLRGRWMNKKPVSASRRIKMAADNIQSTLDEPFESLQEVPEYELEELIPIEKTQPVGGLSAYGCVYHVGAQSIAVTVPGDSVPVKFSHSAYLSGVWHEDDTPDLVIKEQGIYEISYALYMSGITEAAVAIAVQSDGNTLPGSLQRRFLTSEEQVYGGMVVAELWKDSMLRVIMTSGTVVSAEFKGSGVTATLVLKKLD